MTSPVRADLVAALGETTGEAAFRAVRDRMRRTESGRKLLRLRPRMTVSWADSNYSDQSAAAAHRARVPVQCPMLI